MLTPDEVRMHFCRQQLLLQSSVGIKVADNNEPADIYILFCEDSCRIVVGFGLKIALCSAMCRPSPIVCVHNSCPTGRYLTIVAIAAAFVRVACRRAAL